MVKRGSRALRSLHASVSDAWCRRGSVGGGGSISCCVRCARGERAGEEDPGPQEESGMRFSNDQGRLNRYVAL
jgi:hypothetical protein